MHLYFDLPLFIELHDAWFDDWGDADPDHLEAIEYYFSALCHILHSLSLGRPEGLDVYVRKQYIQGGCPPSVLEAYVRVKVQPSGTWADLLTYNQDGSTKPLQSLDVFVGPQGHHPGPVFSSNDFLVIPSAFRR